MFRTKKEKPWCVALGVSGEHLEYGQSWCGRKNVYMMQYLPILEAIQKHDRGGMLDTRPCPIDKVTVIRTMVDVPMFLNVQHAALTARNRSLPKICSACYLAIINTLVEGAA